MRQKDEVKTVGLNYKTEEENDTSPLFSLVKDSNGDYFIDPEKVLSTDKLWLVVRAMKSDSKKLSYELQKGDIIKLGRIQFRVKDIQTPTIPKNNPNNIEPNEDLQEIRSIICKNEEVTENEEDSSIPQ